MAPVILLKPENALKRAEELETLNQPFAAFQSLHDLIISKRHRSNNLNLEKIMEMYIKLAVNMKKGKMVREGLVQYRNTVQNTGISEFENVIKNFISTAENKVVDAIEKLQSIAMNTIDDLEEIETPESILMKTVTKTDQKYRNDREQFMPWLKFLWEAYKIALDTSRNNTKLEELYAFFAEKAFKFCIKYSRVSEFKYICEVIRSHLLNIGRSAQYPPNLIQLKNSNSLRIQLEIRFNQLNTAIKFELWNEAFKSIEDIKGLFSMGKTTIKTNLMINYYECLVKIFKVSGNLRFYAASWNKLLTFNTNSNISNDNIVHIAIYTLLAALAIPIRKGNVDPYTNEMDITGNNQIKESKLISIIGLNKNPTREYLIKNIVNSNYWNILPQYIKDFYIFIETNITPKKLSQYQKLAKPVIEYLGEENKTIISHIEKIILYRIIDNLTKVYSKISFDRLLGITKNLSIVKSIFELENFLFTEFQHKRLLIMVNHKMRCFEFSKSIYSDFVNFKEFISYNKLIEIRLCSGLFDNTINDENYYNEMEKKIDEESLDISGRCLLIEKRKEKQEQEILKKGQQEALEREINMQKELLTEKKRREDESKRRQLMGINKERDEIQLREKRKIVHDVNLKLALVGKKFDVKDLTNLDHNDILLQQTNLLEEGKKEMEYKLLNIYKEIDYFDRAVRLAEIEALSDDCQSRMELERVAYIDYTEYRLKEEKYKIERKKQLKERSKIISPDLPLFVSYWDKNNKEAIEKKVEEANILLEEAKVKRLDELKDQKHQEILAKESLEKSKALALDFKNIQIENEKQDKILARQMDIQQRKEEEISLRTTKQRNYMPENPISSRPKFDLSGIKNLLPNISKPEQNDLQKDRVMEIQRKKMEEIEAKIASKQRNPNREATDTSLINKPGWRALSEINEEHAQHNSRFDIKKTLPEKEPNKDNIHDNGSNIYGKSPDNDGFVLKKSHNYNTKKTRFGLNDSVFKKL